MARSFDNASLASIVAQGIDRPFPAIRDWSRDTIRGLRSTVLPELGSGAEPQPDVVAAVTPPATERRPHRVLVRRVLLATIVALLLLAVGLVVFRGVYAGRVYPAVVVGDVPVGGLTIDDAQSRLTKRASDLERGMFTFSHEGQTWTPSLTEMGVTVNLDLSLTQAEQLGRTGNAASRLGFVAEALSADHVVPLQTQIDRRMLAAWFDSVDRDIDQLPVDARIAIESGEVSVLPGASGIVVDREAATELVLSALSSLEPITVKLPTMVAEPQINSDMLTPIKGQVSEAIGTPITATLFGEKWEITGDTIAPYLMVDVSMKAGEPKANLTVDRDGLASELRTRFSDKVSRKPVNAVVAWDDGLVALEPSVTGAALRSDAFADEVAESFFNGHHDVEIPAVIIEPEIDSSNLAKLGIKELLGTGHSNFAGGVEARDENIRVATRLMNGTLVPPGGVFSFNGAIGEITADKGYQEALVVSGDQVGRDVGGGVCQVSTTVFRAALNAGMPIVEWYPHTYRLPDYERDGWGPGFDASILQFGPNPDEWPDFRFENYSDSWLLVESYIT
ncbi:MAG TPA: VanW family protein, partial [Thermomicrobiales bacterium]|nr:VanW family protein [Thermomicrobiales bacterium]